MNQGNNGCVKTKMFCDEMWEDFLLIDLPPQKEEDKIHLKMTVPSFGKLNGTFQIVKKKQVYNAKESGYVQHIHIQPD